MKRHPGEDFHKYRERRKKSNLMEKTSKIVRIFFTGGTYRKYPKVKIEATPGLISPAVGKRHKGESLKNFRNRRMVCNQKRRVREKGVML